MQRFDARQFVSEATDRSGRGLNFCRFTKIHRGLKAGEGNITWNKKKEFRGQSTGLPMMSLLFFSLQIKPL